LVNVGTAWRSERICITCSTCEVLVPTTAPRPPTAHAVETLLVTEARASTSFPGRSAGYERTEWSEISARKKWVSESVGQ